MITIKQVKEQLRGMIALSEGVPSSLTTCKQVDAGSGRSLKAPATSDLPEIAFIRVGRPTVCSASHKKHRSISAKERDSTAKFIAQARTLTPAACKALLLTIETLEHMSTYPLKAGQVSKETLEFIRQSWEAQQ